MASVGKAVRVALLRGIDKPLAYTLPDSLAKAVQRGSLVNVPLRGTSANAVVLETLGASEAEAEASGFRLKKVNFLVQPERALTDDLLEVARWISAYYGCGLQSVFEAMIPAAVRAGKGALEAKQVRLLRELSEAELDKLRARAPAQAKICSALAGGAPMLLSALLKLAKVPASAADALEKKGLLEISKTEISRSGYDDETAAAELTSNADLELNEEQLAAFEAVRADASSGKFSPRLLYGVTGSGKTEVYIRAMKSVIAGGGTCIFLVPEISLTPQTVGRLKSRLGDCGLVVWHSGLTSGQRLDAWRAIARGEAKVVVGARSCVFAPLENLRLIIVDEEHDGAYKQDSVPRYNARDIAILRAQKVGAACVLGSATPALETLNNAESGKYALSRITRRIDGAKMPRVYIVDMTREKGGALLSRALCDKIAQRLERSEQIILLLNRRGYSKIFECPDCGYVEQCPHCSVSMTWHRSEDLVKCHVCGYSKRAPFACPECGSQKAHWRGHGTQKVEDVAAKMFPAARIGRMDRDAMKRRDNYRKILGDFRTGRLDILIGTQMIAKGLDFPRVTLVGIIDADTCLRMPDFRAAEKTYQLIVQVAGRAGRGNDEGEVIVQTRSPEAAPIQFAKRDDMQAFLEEELAARREFGYPPATRLIRQIFRSRSERKLSFYTEEWAKLAQARFGNLCQIRGPAPAPLERTQDFYRWHIWYFCRSIRPVVSQILALKRDFPMDADVEEVLDVDPISLM